MSSEIKERITDLLRNKRTQLPTLPVVVQNVIRVCRDDTTSAADLARFIGQDQALANKVLRLANSPYYGMGGKVDTILRAITVVGFDEVVSLAIGIGVFPALKGKGSEALRLLDVERLWLHAIGCCFAGRLLCSYLGGNGCDSRHNEKSVFLTCLLHDIGKILFALYFGPEYAEVLHQATAAGTTPLHHVERQRFACDHALFAALLMRHWNFPDAIVMPVRYHHQGENCPVQYRDDVAVVWLANFLVREAGIGYSCNPVPYPGRAAQRLLAATAADVDDLIATLANQRQEVEAFLQLLA